MNLQHPPQLKKIDDLKKKLLREGSENLIEEVEGWERDVKANLITLSMEKNEGVVMLKAKIQEEIDEVKMVLENAYSKDLSDRERDRLLDKKELYIWFLNLFEVSRSTVGNIEADVDKNLSDTEAE